MQPTITENIFEIEKNILTFYNKVDKISTPTEKIEKILKISENLPKIFSVETESLYLFSHAKEAVYDISKKTFDYYQSAKVYQINELIKKYINDTQEIILPVADIESYALEDKILEFFNIDIVALTTPPESDDTTESEPFIPPTEITVSLESYDLIYYRFLLHNFLINSKDLVIPQIYNNITMVYDILFYDCSLPKEDTKQNKIINDLIDTYKSTIKDDYLSILEKYIFLCDNGFIDDKIDIL